MSAQYQVEDFVSRQGLLALLVAQIATVILHLGRLPIWLILISLVVIIWRVQIYRNLWSFPNRFVRILLVLFSIAAVVTYYREWYALEPMVILLIMAYLLKLLEVDKKRDGVVLVFVGYFVASATFLFDQGIVSTLSGLAVIWLLTACLLILHSSVTQFISHRTIRVVSVLLIQAVPLMLLMLFVFPRIGALWSVPLKTSDSVTGVSDSMSPGDFSQLTRSRELAFRVSFENDRVPDPAYRYWRGLVLTEFDGRRWQRLEDKPQFFGRRQTLWDYQNKPEFRADNSQPTVNYEVVLETTNTPWLYGIPLASIKDKKVTRTATNELLLSEPVTQRIKYQASSSISYQVEETEASLRQYRFLPTGFNPKTLFTAAKWMARAGSTENYIARVLAHYNESFVYTLSPPKLGLNTIDEFLFSTQRGFCEHFSSSFVVLMRAAGIPARVVVGYQGGEWNEEDQYLIVRQYDAHAWAEVWISERGWVRVDPTAAVAPNRIEQGLLDSLIEQDQDLIDASLLPSFQWLNRLALQWDGWNYRWQRWVLSYDQDMQSRWLKNVLGEITATRLVILLIAPGAVMLLFFAFLSLRGIRYAPMKKVKLYRLLEKRLERRGVLAAEGETVGQYCGRAASSLPERGTKITQAAGLMNKILYAHQGDIDSKTYQRISTLIRKI